MTDNCPIRVNIFRNTLKLVRQFVAYTQVLKVVKKLYPGTQNYFFISAPVYRIGESAFFCYRLIPRSNKPEKKIAIYDLFNVFHVNAMIS